MSQTARIKAHLRQGGRITPLKALRMFGCFRLGARIYELRRMGLNVQRRMVKVGRATVAEYRL